MKRFSRGNTSISGGSEVKVGEYDGVTDTLDLHRGQPMVWRGRSPPKDRTVHVIEHSTVNITIYVTIASVASVGILLAVVFLAINIRYRNQRYLGYIPVYCFAQCMDEGLLWMEECGCEWGWARSVDRWWLMITW